MQVLALCVRISLGSWYKTSRFCMYMYVYIRFKLQSYWLWWQSWTRKPVFQILKVKSWLFLIASASNTWEIPPKIMWNELVQFVTMLHCYVGQKWKHVPLSVSKSNKINEGLNKTTIKGQWQPSQHLPPYPSWNRFIYSLMRRVNSVSFIGIALLLMSILLSQRNTLFWGFFPFLLTQNVLALFLLTSAFSL